MSDGVMGKHLKTFEDSMRPRNLAHKAPRDRCVRVSAALLKALVHLWTGVVALVVAVQGRAACTWHPLIPSRTCSALRHQGGQTTMVNAREAPETTRSVSCRSFYE